MKAVFNKGHQKCYDRYKEIVSTYNELLSVGSDKVASANETAKKHGVSVATLYRAIRNEGK